MLVPFPSISAGLAVKAHMYICGRDNAPDYGFIKCQTLKPRMLGSDLLAHYVDENPDLSRNPFRYPTRIDCDKFFVTASVRYDDGLKTTTRPDVCQDLYDEVRRELAADGCQEIAVKEDELVSLNPRITKIQIMP